MNHKKRTQTVLQLLENENADWFFVHHLPNVRYLSGFTGSSAALLISLEKQYILTDGRYQEQVIREAPDYTPIIQGKRKLWEAAKDELGELSSSTVWFESEHCSFARFEEMQKNLPAKEYIGKKEIVENLRSVKDEEEIEIVRKALSIAEIALYKALDSIKENMTERELAHILEDEMWRLGAAKESFESLVLFGERSSLCHGKPSERKLRRGDAVLMDFGCVVDGYCSDITRIVFFGQPSDRYKDVYQCVLQANQAAEAKIKAGIHGKDADEFAREVVRAAGWEAQFVHGLGHGVGLEVHEAPRLSYLAEGELQAGNVATIEPGIYIENFGGVRIEDMAVIRENGCEILNRTPKEMMIL
ncbi:MAG: Xaa-Pro peptidase family protein [Candidatus Omnitrophota bacterium]